MSVPSTPGRQPIQAGPARRAFHTLVAAGGWVLFVYWWWLVFSRVSDVEIRYTLRFVGIALVVIVLVTALWAFHNVRLFRNKRARTHVRTVREDFSHDTVGRPVGMPAVPDECLTASVIVVRIEDGTKVYRPTVIRSVAARPTDEQAQP